MRIDSLEHQQRPPQVTITVRRNAFIEPRRFCPALLFDGSSKYLADLGLSRRGDADKQGARADRGNDVSGTVGQQYQTQCRTVVFHCTAKSGLCVTREMVGFVDDDNLEALTSGNVHLLRLRNLLQQLLDDDTVIVADIGRGDFEVINRGHDVELELAVAARLEGARVDLDLLDGGTEKRLECRNRTRLLAGT